jgi:tetratricopeptide (TPR) repeat protein
LFRAEGDRRGEARATYHLAFTRRRLGDPQSALGLTEQALATYVELGDAGGQAAAHQALGVLYKDYLIDLDKSEQHLLAAFQLVSDRPDDRGVGQVMFSLGLLYTAQERVFDAMAMFRQALERVRRNNDSIGVATVLRGLGALLVNHNPADAGALLAEAASISRQIGNRGTLAEVLRWQAELAERAGRIRAAIDYLREAKALLATLGFSKEHEALSTRLATLEARRRSA